MCVCVCEDRANIRLISHVRASKVSIYFRIAINDLHRLRRHIGGQTHQTKDVGCVVTHLFGGRSGRGSRELASCEEM